MRRRAGELLLTEIERRDAVAADLAHFHPDTVPVFHETGYLLQNPQADYWTLSNFYNPQSTSSACSAATAAMLVSALAAVPHVAGPAADITEDRLVASVGGTDWVAQVAEGGSGVTFEEMREYLHRSLEWIDLKAVAVQAVAPEADGPASLDALRQALAENEDSAGDFMLAYYNQGVVTGDGGGLHVSPIGAYNAEADRVLIMDVDRELHLPYWTSTQALLQAFVTPAPAADGPLAGRSGGYIRLTRR